MDPVSPPLLTVPALGVRERPGVMVSVALKVRMASLWAACAGRAAQPTNRIKSAAAKTKESRFILSTPSGAWSGTGTRSLPGALPKALTMSYGPDPSSRKVGAELGQMPSSSTKAQCSTILPASMRKMLMPPDSKRFPVGIRPKNSWACVPANVKRWTTPSPSAITSSVV